MDRMDRTVSENLANLAARHGLALVGDLTLTELGLDFRVGFGQDADGISWVLRQPRRPDVQAKVDHEARILRFLHGRLPVAVPDWEIQTSELIAYRRLPGITGVTVDPQTYEPTWNFDKESPGFLQSFANALAALHGINIHEAQSAGLRVTSPGETRQKLADDLKRVNREIGMGPELRSRMLAWLDDENAWPTFSTLIHGDLHVGHLLLDEESQVSGILDWTEAEVSDPSIDFMYHLMGFGEPGLDQLLDLYERAGGRRWPGMTRQIAERLASFPIKYALFALESPTDETMAQARSQLGLPT